MQQTILSDKPVSLKNEDRFQRYDFSKRIAQRIINSENNDSIVIGIYGSWGEGKTSVINFVEAELLKNDSIISIRFNPWRFTEEATLLISFFNTLASEIKASFSKEEFKTRRLFKRRRSLKKKYEIIGELLEKYGGIVSFFGVGKAAESLGKSLSNVEIETLKKRFEKLLIESNKKIVVFIDDIDRLDKQEIHSIFRLVKLTADFSNTFYILSFDQEMVASAIGERFGEGDKQAGYNFLEKIIQVQLKIPVAQPEALKQYCFELVENIITKNQLKINNDDYQRFIYEFIENVLIRLKTPRLAVRYGNTLSFALPLLIGEVNLVDLMLIEAIKIFYPLHYEFVKNNSQYFLSSYSIDSNHGIYNDIEEKKKELVNSLEELGNGLTKRERESIKALLSELFPRLDEAFRNTFRHNGLAEWHKNKRIVSPDYFKRYFSYTILKGEISDVSFESLIASIDDSTETQIINSFIPLIQSSSIDKFLHKLRVREEDFTWITAKKLALSIALSGDLFKEDHTVFRFRTETANSQAAIFIYQLIKKHTNKEESFRLAEELMKKASPFSFAYEINNWLRTGDSEEDKIFTIDQYQSLAKYLISRALSEAGEIPVFEKFPDNVQYILRVWKEVDTNEFNQYFTKILDSNPEKVKSLLRAFTPLIKSSTHPEPYKSDFKREHFDFFCTLFNSDYINEKLLNYYGDKVAHEDARFNESEGSQNNINILKQFRYWYLNSK